MSIDAPTGHHAIKRILVVAGSADGDSILVAASELAERHMSKLDVLICVEPPSDLSVIARAADLAQHEVLERMGENKRKQVAAQLARFQSAQQAEFHVCTGKAFIEIIHHVHRLDVDLVVKMAEPLSGLRGFLFASTDQHLMRKCPCPVWLHLPGTARIPRTILAAVDVDNWDTTEPETLADLNRRVLEMSMRLCPDRNATIHVVHAWEAMGEGMVRTFASEGDSQLAADRYVNEVLDTRRRSLDAFLDRVREDVDTGGIRLIAHLIRGPAHTVIAEQAKQLRADVIVMGTVARTGVSGVIIGNTAENILNTVECSVVTVKPTGFVSPIVVE